MEFFFNVRGRGLRNSIEYKSDNNILFSNAIKEQMLKKNIFVDAKWHRICLPLALNITQKEIENNLDILINVFKNVHNNWFNIKRKKINSEKFF